MAEKRPHTRDFPVESRRRLGIAATRAREALGHPWRPSFAKLAKLSVRSIVKIESGDPVGPSVYEAIARVLPNWTEDTPVAILDGALIPPTESSDAGQSDTPWMSVATDAQIVAMNGYDIGMHYIKLEREYGEEAADDWVVKAAIVRRDARRASKTLATDKP